MVEQNGKRNIRNIVYGVIGIATLMIAVVGATFAYFTATASNNATLTGNMGEIDFDIAVKKVTTADNTNGGMIPMSNNMMEKALQSSKGICVDDNGNAVCQIYRVTVTNKSTASIFVDGYVTLTGGSGTPEDYETVDNPATTGTTERQWKYSAAGAETTMRWAQVFCKSDVDDVVSNCSTAGKSSTRTDSAVSIAALGGTNVANDGHNTTEIKDVLSTVIAEHNIHNNPYDIINRNYIRVSDHLANDTTYSREEDVTSALVFSQYLEADDDDDTNHVGNSDTTTFTDAQVLYFVVWLSENGHNQTSGSAGAATSRTAYFQGKVNFISAQGDEVSATFASHARVSADTPL